MRALFAGVVISCCVLTACSTSNGSADVAQAEIALVDYFQYLAEENYQAAVELYGGDYHSLQTMNPLIPSEDHESLLAAGCTLNGFQCLPVRQVLSSRQNFTTEFVFTLTFETPEGEILKDAACCGENGGEGLQDLVFEVHVNKIDGRYSVKELPPYRP
jgi:hypothetical protein